MVDRILTQRVNVAPTFGNPVRTFANLGFPPGVVRSVSLVVPDGVNAAVGVGIGYGGQVVIPDNDQLIFTNGEVITWPVDGLPVGVQWQLAYESSAYNWHTFTVRLSVDELPAPVAGSPLPTSVIPTVQQAPVDLFGDQAPADLTDTVDVTP